MIALTNLRRYVRFALRLKGALRHPMTLEQARDRVRRRLAERDANFLRVAERAIYGHPRSPYRPLLKRAGIELGDLRRMVRTDGLEPTLRALHEAGVYVTLEEFKGRTPIVRGELAIPARARDFDNRDLRPDYQGESGGTTGPATRVGISLENIAAQAPYFLLTYDAHGIMGAPIALWRGVLPDTSGLNLLLRGGLLIGQPVVKWFSPFTSTNARLSWRARLTTQLIITIGRLSGLQVPWPEHVGLNDAVTVARWAADTVQAHGAATIFCNASRALRVALAAREHTMSLAGVTIIGGGEPPTPAKVASITATGARWIPTYAFTEAGVVGIGCARPIDGEDVHLFADLQALIQAPQPIGGSTFTVPAFWFSTLSLAASKIMLNAQIGDYGILERRSCGCPLERYGLVDHVRQIRSFGKLTSEGMALLERDMIRVLEEVLPARFGGTALDYQLVEEEDSEAFTRLNLLISPRVEIADEAAVVKALLQNFMRGPGGIWAQGRTIRVVRRDPITSGRGKLIPLHLGRPESTPSDPLPRRILGVEEEGQEPRKH